MSSADRIRRRLVAHRRSSTRNLTELCDVFSVIDSETHKIVKYCLPELVKEGTISAERAEEYKKIPVYKLEYDEETDDVIAYEEDGDEGFYECSVQEDGTIDGCLDLLHWLEEGKFTVRK